MDKILHRFMSCMAHDTTLTSPHTHSDFNIGGSLTHRKGTPFEWTKSCTGQPLPNSTPQH